MLILFICTQYFGQGVMQQALFRGCRVIEKVPQERAYLEEKKPGPMIDQRKDVSVGHYHLEGCNPACQHLWRQQQQIILPPAHMTRKLT